MCLPRGLENLLCTFDFSASLGLAFSGLRNRRLGKVQLRDPMLLDVVNRRLVGQVQMLEDVLNQARPQVSFDVVPRVEFDLDDALVERFVALHRLRIACVV